VVCPGALPDLPLQGVKASSYASCLPECLQQRSPRKPGLLKMHASLYVTLQQTTAELPKSAFAGSSCQEKQMTTNHGKAHPGKVLLQLRHLRKLVCQLLSGGSAYGGGLGRAQHRRRGAKVAQPQVAGRPAHRRTGVRCICL